MANWYDACVGCAYLGVTAHCPTCDYALIAGQCRPCPRGPGCTVKEVAETKKWDKAKAFELYQAGLTDLQIANELGVSQRTIFVWRKDRMLPPNRRVSPAVPEAEPVSAPPSPPEPEPPPEPETAEVQPESEPEGTGQDGSGPGRFPDGPMELHLELGGGWIRLRATDPQMGQRLCRVMAEFVGRFDVARLGE